MTTRLARVVIVVGAAAALLAALGAPPAFAHAVVLDASPQDGAELDDAPEQVTLRFNEPVDLPTNGLQVFDANADPVDEGTVDDGDPSTISVALPDDLEDAAYIVSWRVVSLDTHVVGGVMTFTVGDADAVGDSVVAEVADGGSAVRTDLVVTRGLTYGATLLAVGALAFTALVSRRQQDRDRARRVGLGAALVGVVVTVASIPVHGAAVTGSSLTEAVMSAGLLGEALTTSAGEGALVRAVALAVLAFLWWLRLPLRIAALPALGALASFLMDGHQRTIEPTWLLAASDLVHLLAGAVWLGGLVLLAASLRPHRIREAPVAGARTVARFSNVALASAALVVVSGVAMGWVLVRSPGELVESAYGWTLLGKVLGVAVVLGLAAYNRQRLVPAVVAAGAPAGGSTDVDAVDGGPALARDARARRLRATVRLEAGVLAVVLLVTGALVNVEPPAATGGAGDLFQTTIEVTDEVDLDVVVDPGSVGVNTLHFFLLDSGRPSDVAEELVVELTYVDQGIGPIEIQPFPAGTGHWMVNTDDIAFAGRWEMLVVVAEDEFTQHRDTIEFEVSS